MEKLNQRIKSLEALSNDMVTTIKIMEHDREAAIAAVAVPTSVRSVPSRDVATQTMIDMDARDLDNIALNHSTASDEETSDTAGMGSKHNEVVQLGDNGGRMSKLLIYGDMSATNLEESLKDTLKHKYVIHNHAAAQIREISSKCFELVMNYTSRDTVTYVTRILLSYVSIYAMVFQITNLGKLYILEKFST